MARTAALPAVVSAIAGRADNGRRRVRDLLGVSKPLGCEFRLKAQILIAEPGELHILGLSERLGQPATVVSHILSLFRVAGLVERRRDTRRVQCRVRGDRLAEMLTLAPAFGGPKVTMLKPWTFLLTNGETEAERRPLGGPVHAAKCGRCGTPPPASAC